MLHGRAVFLTNTLINDGFSACPKTKRPRETRSLSQIFSLLRNLPGAEIGARPLLDYAISVQKIKDRVAFKCEARSDGKYSPNPQTRENRLKSFENYRRQTVTYPHVVLLTAPKKNGSEIFNL